MKFYKLTDTLNCDEVVMCKEGKNYTYRFGAETWIRSAIMVRYTWPDDSRYGKYVEITEEEALRLLDSQRQKLNGLLQLAIETATAAHAGQTDKGGNPYFLHLQAVASGVDHTEAKIVAYLHDICEDTPTSPEDLLAMGFTRRIVASVDILTKKDAISYEDYLKAVRSDSLARAVKLSDLKNNMDISRIPSPTPADFERLGKYQHALDFLQS